MQNTSPDKSLWVCFFLLGLTCSAGCHAPRPSFLNDLFAIEDTSYKLQYGPTPAQRVEELRALAASVGSLTAQQKSTASQKIAEEIGAESDPLIRKELVAALGVFADPNALPALHAAMADPDPMVRIAGCEAWSRRPTAEALAVLAHTMSNDSSVQVRQAATRVLGNFKSPDAIRRLATALDDKDPATQLLAIRSLASATGKQLGNSATKWRDYVASTYGPAINLDNVYHEGGAEMIADRPDDDDETWR